MKRFKTKQPKKVVEEIEQSKMEKSNFAKVFVKDEVKIKSEVLEDDQHSVELTTFICQSDLDIKQDFKGDRIEMLMWTDENHTNEIRSNENHSSLTIPVKVKEPNVFDLSSQIEKLEENKIKIESEELESNLSSQIEEFEENKVKIESEVLEDDQHSVELTTFICHPDLDIKQDFEGDRTELLQWTDESAGMVKTSSSVIASAQSLKAKAEQLVLTSRNHSKRRLVLTAIPTTDNEKQNKKCSKAIVDMMKSSLFNLFHKGREYNINELVPAYNCVDDGFPSCPFKTLYFDEYLKHVDTIHEVEGLGLFSSKHKLQRELIMEGWLAREVGLFQCKYCKKATVTYLEMEKHQAVSHAQKKCYIYYRKFIPNDTVTIPQLVNLEDPSFINHVVHLPDQIHLCDFKLRDGLLSSTSQLPTRDHENSDQQKILLDDSEISSLPVDNKAGLLNESEILNVSVDIKLQCEWEGCYQTYDSQVALVKHVKKNHVQLQSGKQFTCLWNNCLRKSKLFNTRFNLLLHLRIHTGERPYKCPLQGCNRTFSRRDHLKSHQKAHLRERPYRCQFPNCLEMFSTIDDKDNHQRLHYNPEAYVCQVTGCCKRYNHLNSLQQHMKNHTDDEQLEAKWKLVESKEKDCDFVVKNFSDSSDEDIHQRTHYNKLQCKWEGCYQTYDSQMAFLKHIEKNHVQLQNGKQATCLWNNCSRKSKPFISRSHLVIHMRSHTGERPYKCPLQGCNKAFSRRDHLMCHQKGHMGERPYQCQFPNCFKMFSSIRDKENHQRWHYNPLQCKWKGCYQTYDSQMACIKHIKKNHVQLQSGKEFTCFWDNCSRKSKPFSGKCNLLRHLRSHTGEKPYKCAFQGCNKIFSQLIQLTIHKRRHTGERPYRCQFSNCFKSFSTVYDKNNHQRLHYNPESYACQVTGCSKKYNQPGNLRTHMKTHTVDEQLESKRKLVQSEEKEVDLVLKKSSNSSDRDKDQETHYDSEAYACQVTGCSKKYKHLKALQKHMKIHPVDEQLETKWKLFQNKEKEGDSSNGDKHQKRNYDSCKWEDCSETHNSQKALVKHIKKNHVLLQSGKEFTCLWNNCPRKSKPYNRRCHLLLHMRIHTGERLHKCTFQGCNKVFSRLTPLRVHQRKHTGERPYRCQFSNCFKRFPTAYVRDNHQMLHYNPEAYACQVTGCFKKYSHWSTLQRHMENHTVDEQLEIKEKLVENKGKEDDLMVKKSSNSSDETEEQCNTVMFDHFHDSFLTFPKIEKF